MCPAVSNLDGVPRRNPVSAPELEAVALAPHPGTDKVPVVGVGVVVGTVVIHILAAAIGEGRRVGPGHFGAEIKLWNARNLRQVNARTHQRTLRRPERRGVIVGHAIVVKGHPFSQAGKAVAEVETAAPVADVGGAARDRSLVVAKTAEASPEHAESYRSEDNGARESELQIFRGLETELLALDRRQRRVVMPGH